MSATRTFLVVDDSYIDRLVCGLLIKRTFPEAEVAEAGGGSQAIEWLGAKKFSDGESLVIVLDIMMPQMNGFEFLDLFENLQSNVKEKSTVIMLSSTLDTDDMNRARNHPRVRQLLSKPLSASDLKQAVIA